jgi:hypothetical protein
MFFDLIPAFSRKKFTFCDFKSGQDPDLDSDPHWFGSQDPDPHSDKIWIRIRNNAYTSF